MDKRSRRDSCLLFEVLINGETSKSTADDVAVLKSLHRKINIELKD